MQLLHQGRTIMVRLVVGVAGEQLVRSFAGEDDRDMLCGKLRNEPARNSRPHQIPVVAFEVIENLRQCLTNVTGGDPQLVMLRSQKLGHTPGGKQIVGTFEANRKRMHVRLMTAGQCRDD